MNKKNATGVLASLLKKTDKRSLERTRNRMLLAQKIGMGLREMGLSQKQLAAQMGKTESEISDWLSGDRNFTVDTLTDIEQHLDIRLLDTFFPRTVVIPQHPSYVDERKQPDIIQINISGNSTIPANLVVEEKTYKLGIA